jgi:hypothetical protein
MEVQPTTSIPLAAPASDDLKQFEHEHECRVRDLYASRLRELRPLERLLATEHSYAGSKIRGDMRTVDADNLIRVWEFEIFCGYTGLGQVLTYVATARRSTNFEKSIRGVLAAFEFQPEVVYAVEVLNLGIEIVHIPKTFRLAGAVLPAAPSVSPPVIPVLDQLKER